MTQTIDHQLHVHLSHPNTTAHNWSHSYTTTYFTRGKKFSAKIKCKQGRACEKYRNKEEMKKQEDYPAPKKSW